MSVERAAGWIPGSTLRAAPERRREFQAAFQPKGNTMPKTRKHTRTRRPDTREQPRTSERMLRGWSDVLKMWAACDNAACRAAGCCRGAVHACAPKNFSALPEGVKGFACVLWDAREQGLSFDEAMEGFEGSRAEAALNDWVAQVEARQA
jgi:hypothetical protein